MDNEDRWRQAVKASCNNANYRKTNGLTNTKDDTFVDGVLWADEHPDPNVKREWLKEAVKYLTDLKDKASSMGLLFSISDNLIYKFKLHMERYGDGKRSPND